MISSHYSEYATHAYPLFWYIVRTGLAWVIPNEVAAYLAHPVPGRPPPHAAVREDHEQVPDEGNGAVVEAIRHMLEFALELLGTGNLSGVVDSEYVQGLHWYKSLPAVLAGNAPR